MRAMRATIAVVLSTVAALAATTSISLAEGHEVVYSSPDTCNELTALGSTFDESGIATLEVPEGPGPVRAAILTWVGSDDTTPDGESVDGRADSELVINGEVVTGNQATGEAGSARAFAGATWYAWSADLGPDGAGLVTDVASTLTVEGWDGRGAHHGVALTIVHDSSPCEVESSVQLLAGVDVHFHGIRSIGGGTTPQIYGLPPSDTDRVATLVIIYAGVEGEGEQCRGTAVWMAAGDGDRPAAGTSLYAPSADQRRGAGLGGAVEIVNDAFTAPGHPCSATINPAPDTDQEPNHPYPGGAADAPYRAVELRPSDGGLLGEGLAVVEIDVVVPAGTTWIAFQLESEADQHGQSGAWAGGGVLLPNSATSDGTDRGDTKSDDVLRAPDATSNPEVLANVQEPSSSSDTPAAPVDPPASQAETPTQPAPPSNLPHTGPSGVALALLAAVGLCMGGTWLARVFREPAGRHFRR